MADELINFLSTMTTGEPYRQHVEEYKANPLWESLGPGSGPHAQSSEAAAQGFMPAGLIMQGGLGVEGLEGSQQSAIASEDPRSQTFLGQVHQALMNPFGGITQNPDTYKDTMANMLGAISGARGMPEQLKAMLMNKLVPFTQGMDMGFSGGNIPGQEGTTGFDEKPGSQTLGKHYNLDTGQMVGMNQGPQGVTPGNQMIEFFQQLFGGAPGGTGR